MEELGLSVGKAVFIGDALGEYVGDSVMGFAEGTLVEGLFVVA